MKNQLILSSFISLLTASLATAGDSPLRNPLSTGVAFPAIPDSTLLNPAGLAQEKAGAIRANYTIPSSTYSAQSALAEIGYSSGIFGLGAYGHYSTTASIDRAGAGLGIKLGSASIGASATLPLGTGTSSPSFNGGLIWGKDTGFRLGVAAYNLQSISTTGTYTAGLGYAKTKEFSMELDYTGSLGSSSRGFKVAFARHSGPYAASGYLSYDTSALGISMLNYGIAGDLIIKKNWIIGLSYDTVAMFSSNLTIDLAYAF